MPDWIPFGATPGEQRALVDGVPPWLALPLKSWVLTNLSEGRTYSGDPIPDISAIAEYDMATRRAPTFAAQIQSWGFSRAYEKLEESRKLELADWLLHHKRSPSDARQLEYILNSAGSAWRVGARNGNDGLERRVSEGLLDAADAVMSNGSEGSAAQIGDI